MDLIAGNDKVGSKVGGYGGDGLQGLATTSLRGGMVDPLINRTIADTANETGAIENVRISQSMTPNLVAITDPNNIVIRNIDDGSLVCSKYVEAGITAAPFGERVAIKPDHQQFAYVISRVNLFVASIPDGDTIFELGGLTGRFGGCAWTDDCSKLVCYGDFGVCVYDSMGTKLQLFFDGVSVTHASTRGSLVGCGGSSRTVSIIDVDSDSDSAILHTFVEESPTLSVIFDTAGTRVAYSSQHAVSVRDVADGSLVAKFDFTAGQRMSFNPWDNDMIVNGTGSGRFRDKFGRKIRILDCKTGEELSWGPLLHAAFDLETITGNTVGIAVDNSSATPNLLIYGGEKHEALFFDMQRFKKAALDGAITATQLMALSTRRPDQIKEFSRTFPSCVNIQEAESGDTVLHWAARTGRGADLQSWLTSGGAEFTPIGNRAGHTALHEAIKIYNAPIVLQLIEALTSQPTASTAGLLTDAIETMAVRMPRLVLRCLQIMEESSSVLPTLSETRTTLERTEVRGLDTMHWSSKLSVSGSGDVFEQEFRGEHQQTDGDARVQEEASTLWDDIMSDAASANGVRVAFQVVAIEYFIGSPSDSPFHAIVKHCDAEVFQSRLLQLAVQYK
jgi:hypothetical protein